MGCNAVRTSHNMPTPEWVEACDRMGLMMMCEMRQRQLSERHCGAKLHEIRTLKSLGLMNIKLNEAV
jgi:hypothetical protein